MINYCNQYNCPYFNLNEGCSHPSQPMQEWCDIRKHLPKDPTQSITPLMYVKFTFRDQWRHIPAEEMYPAWKDKDIFLAAHAFRRRHGAGGALVVFRTYNLIEWEIVEQSDI